MHMTNKILRPQKILHLSSHPPPYSFEKLFVSYEFWWMDEEKKIW